jgi:antirestriction protein ArdC
MDRIRPRKYQLSSFHFSKARGHARARAGTQAALLRTLRRERPDLRITDDPRADRAQYLTSWLAVMKADKKAIFAAASKASEAAAFLAALQGA